jgi:hypothetical protein
MVQGQANEVHLCHARKPMGKIVHHLAHIDQASYRF